MGVSCVKPSRDTAGAKRGTHIEELLRINSLHESWLFGRVVDVGHVAPRPRKDLEVQGRTAGQQSLTKSAAMRTRDTGERVMVVVDENIGRRERRERERAGMRGG